MTQAKERDKENSLQVVWKLSKKQSKFKQQVPTHEKNKHNTT